MRLRELSPQSLHERLSTEGIAIAIAPITLRLRSPLRFFAEQMQALYAEFEIVDVNDFADVDIRVSEARSVRRWLRPQVQFVVDGVAPFEPFPLDHALPMFEWGLNWVFANRMHQYLLLHAAVVARDDRALLLPAWPGSGKSTLVASLACRGWRFLSDEFGIVPFGGTCVLPFTRPAALKNESIAVIQAFDANAFIGPVFSKTRKGDVAHFRVPAASVHKGREPAEIDAIVFPDFQAGAPVEVLPLAQTPAFLKLAGNSFNYEVVGERGFRTVTSIVERCPSHILRYGDLSQAHAALAEIINEPVAA
jgi:HprK-related kinase A